MAFNQLNKRRKFQELWDKFQAGIEWLKNNWDRQDNMDQARRLVKEVGEPMDALWLEIQSDSQNTPLESILGPIQPAGGQNGR